MSDNPQLNGNINSGDGSRKRTTMDYSIETLISPTTTNNEQAPASTPVPTNNQTVISPVQSNTSGSNISRTSSLNVGEVERNVLNIYRPIPPVSSSPVREENLREPSDSEVKITLLDEDLWRKFHNEVNEMIVTKEGRRLFPILKFQIEGLDPSTMYTVNMDFPVVETHKWKFMNGEWFKGNKEDTVGDSIMYVHNDSPNFGNFWMGNIVNFSKLKITNKPSADLNKIQIQSLFKYQPRIHVYKIDNSAGVGKLVHQLSQQFDVTSFIAVTAYQNENITKLKVNFNPFAKAFLEPRFQHQPIVPVHSQLLNQNCARLIKDDTTQINRNKSNENECRTPIVPLQRKKYTLEQGPSLAINHSSQNTQNNLQFKDPSHCDFNMLQSGQNMQGSMGQPMMSNSFNRGIVYYQPHNIGATNPLAPTNFRIMRNMKPFNEENITQMLQMNNSIPQTMRGSLPPLYVRSNVPNYGFDQRILPGSYIPSSQNQPLNCGENITSVNNLQNFHPAQLTNSHPAFNLPNLQNLSQIQSGQEQFSHPRVPRDIRFPVSNPETHHNFPLRNEYEFPRVQNSQFNKGCENQSSSSSNKSNNMMEKNDQRKD